MADWENLRHFVVLAREGTLSAAARMLGVDHATVARRVAALEADTGLKLIDRRARSYQLTDDGKRIAATAIPMEEAAFAVGRAVQAARPGLRGEVSISSPPSVTNVLIAPQLFRLRHRHPGIRIKLIGEKRAASLNRREADVALRVTRPQEPGLIARKIGSFGFSLYGAPGYLKETPPHAFAFVAYDDSMNEAPQQKWL
jgi:DNA-binding transcriptional LysR family regulator